MFIKNHLRKPASSRLLSMVLLALIHTNSLLAQVEITEHSAEKSVAISVDGKPITSYIYPNSLKKPVLFPLRTPEGTIVTRAYPLINKAGERVDHPHHVGLWLNYGNVNGLDFWNNSEAIPPEKLGSYGTIRHREVLETESGEEQGMLKVAAEWLAPDQNKLLDETTTFYFFRQEHAYIIDRITTLKALDEDVLFEDNKEGMLGIRVTRALEHPSEKPILLTEDDGEVADEAILDNEGVSGQYISSEGEKGEAVWGTRAAWVNLAGTIENEKVSVVIMDHPENVGFPTYWHARPYGLFAANPLGQEVFSDGKERLNFSLKPQESVTFRYRIVVYGADRPLTEKQIQSFYTDFTDAS